MLGKFAGAMIGKRLAGRSGGLKGAVLGYAVAAIAKRGLGPLSIALGLGWGAKKMWDRRQERHNPRYPSDAAPSSPSGRRDS